MASDQGLYVTVQLVVSPSGVRQVEEFAAFDGKRLELTVDTEGLQKLCSLSRVCAQDHPFSLLVADDPLMDQFFENSISAVEERFKS